MDDSVICTEKSKKNRIFYINDLKKTARNCRIYFDIDKFEDLADAVDDFREMGDELFEMWEDEDDDGDEVNEVEFSF